MRYAHQCPWQRPISLEDMAAVVKIGHILTNHALAVFDLLRLGNTQRLARDVCRWVRDKKCIVFTRRECRRKFRRAEKEELNSSLELLEEKDIIHGRDLFKEKPGGEATFLM